MIDKTKQEVQFAEHCKRTFSAVSILQNRLTFCSMVMQDMNSRLNQTFLELTISKKYSSKMFRSVR